MPLIISFTWWNYTSYSYPKGNFGGNQLLDGSMSLSPLYPCFTIDLHVRTVCGLPSGFPLTWSYTSIDHHLSGPKIYATTQIFHRSSWSADGAPLFEKEFPPVLLSLCIRVFNTQILAHILDSLVRVSRRADDYHFVSVLLLQILERSTSNAPQSSSSWYLQSQQAAQKRPITRINNPHWPSTWCTPIQMKRINITQIHW